MGWSLRALEALWPEKGVAAGPRKADQKEKASEPDSKSEAEKLKAQAGSGVRRAATARPPTETAMHATAATPQAGASAEQRVVANDEEHEGWYPQESETPECQ